MLDAPALVGFVLIAETGSVHAAAKRLNLSQAALSRRLQRLERAMRVQLFVRQGRRLLLSATHRCAISGSNMFTNLAGFGGEASVVKNGRFICRNG